MAGAMSAIVIGCLLAGLFAGTAAAEAFVGASTGDDIAIAAAPAGGTMEAPGERDTVGARGGAKTRWQEAPRTTGRSPLATGPAG